MPDIEYYFSVLSPYTYLAGDRLEQIAAVHGARIIYVPVDIAAVGNETGWTPPAKRHPSRLEYRLQELSRIARQQEMPINLKPAHWPTDPLPASRAIAAAILAERDPAPLIRSTLRAVWAEERDIAERETVDSIVRASGIDSEELEPFLATAEAVYGTNSRTAPERGVFGVPFYIVDGERFWGQDRLSALDRHLATLE